MRVLRRRPLPPDLDLDMIRGEAHLTIDPHLFLTPYYAEKIKEVINTFLHRYIGDPKQTGVEICFAVHDVLMHAWEHGCIWELDAEELAAMGSLRWDVGGQL